MCLFFLGSHQVIGCRSGLSSHLLLNLYSLAANCGDASLSLAFNMLASLVGTMDRLAVGTYHSKIYEHCLAALDLRRQHPDFLKNNINTVEQSIIHAIGHFFFVLWNGLSPKLISPHQRKVWTMQLFLQIG